MRRLLFFTLLAPALSLLAAPAARAQDRLTFKDSHVQEGKVTGMNGNSVLLSVQTGTGPAGSMAFDLGLLSRVDVPPPPAFQAAAAAYGAGDWDKALAALKPLTDQFRGLPTPWARQAAGMLGDIYIEKNDVARAEATYGDFRKLYPAAPGGSSLRYNLGQARIAFVRQNFPAAKQQLDPLAKAALQSPADVSRLDGAANGQVFYLLGQLDERAGNPQAALEDYLRVVTLFYQDNVTAARAQTRADALRAAHKDLAAP